MGIKGLVTLTTIALGLFVGSQLVLQGPSLSDRTSADTRYIKYLPNNDIKIELKDPYGSQNWDYGIEGDICFNQTPPSVNAKFRIELLMKLKDKNDVTKTVNEVIGASVTQLITNPFTLDCSSDRLRRGAFTGVMNIPAKDRWTESCPEILVKVTTTGPWNKTPKPEVATIDRSFLCPDGVPTAVPPSPLPTNQTAPTTAPTQPASTPQPQATFTPAPTARPQVSITGNIAVFSCQAPQKTQLTFCDEQKTKCYDLPFTSGPSTHGVWLDDSVEDRTYRYKYSISQDPSGNDLDSEKKYYIDKAFAVIGGGTKTVTSLKLDKNVVEPGKDRDLSIVATDQTCECKFKAVSQVYEKDSDGEIGLTNSLDKIGNTEITFGTNNDYSLIRAINPNNDPNFNGVPAVGFTNGSFEVEADLASPNKPFPYNPSYGKDGKATIRLYSPGYNVIGQRCRSVGESHSCPEESFEWGKNFPGPANTNNDIKDLRITCGTDITYGWIVEKKQGDSTTPPPQVTQAPQGTPPPPQTTQAPSAQSDIFSPSSSGMRDDNNGNAPQNEQCRPKNFRVTEVKDSGTGINFEWDQLSGCSAFTPGTDRYWILIKDGDRIVASKQGMKDEDPDVKISEKQRGILPENIQIASDDEFKKDVRYTSLLYAYQDHSPRAISYPATANFTGLGKKTDEGGSDGGSSSRSECGTSGCKTFGLIMWDSDRKSDSADHHMCWAVASNGGKKNLKEKSDAGEWNCLNSNAEYSGGKVTKLKTTYKNLASGTARVGWQLSRCKDDESNCTQNPNSPDGDRLEEAADLMCVPPGQDVTCEWEVAYMKPTRMSCNRSKCPSGLQALQEYNLTLDDLDINKDESLNTADLIICIDEWGASGKGLKCDFTKNGTVDALDYSIITTHYGINVNE